MAIGSHGADGRGDRFIDARSLMGSSCEGNAEVLRSMIRESHCGPLDLCTHAYWCTSGCASAGTAPRTHSARTHDLLMPLSTDKAAKPF